MRITTSAAEAVTARPAARIIPVKICLIMPDYGHAEDQRNSGQLRVPQDHASERTEGTLAPAAFHQHPSLAALYPVMSFPTRTSTRWLFPAAGDPYVLTTIPVVIARDPDIATTRGNRSVFHQGAGRPNPNINVGGRGRNCQARCQDHSADYFLNHALLRATHVPMPHRRNTLQSKIL